jgi:ligand-binding sensor domain-containing protein
VGVIVNNFDTFWSLDVAPEGLVVVTGSKLYFYNSKLQLTRTVTGIIAGGVELQPVYRKSMVANDGTLWVANLEGGLFSENFDSTWQQLLPSGPYSNLSFNVNTAGETVWLLPGGFGALYNNAQVPAYISVLSEGSWHYFDRSNTSEFQYARDLINIAVNPADPNKVMVASWGSGIYEFDDLAIKAHYMKDNSGLQNIDWAGSQYTRIWGINYDSENNLWITNTSVDDGIVVLTNDNEWYSYNYATLSTANTIGQILIGGGGYKWCINYRGDAKGLFVFDDNGTIDNQNDDQYRGALMSSSESDQRNAGQLLVWDENGEEITRDMYCMAFDQNGYLWIGTGNGVVVQYNPSSIFSDSQPVFSRIKVARDDGSGLADYLLENERITAIAVDGANRKYVGTQNSGVFLVSEDGTKTVATFNTSNSPLPSNLINHLHINQVSGEVFVATDMGLVSFIGEAVKGGEAFQEVHAYPNPVRSDYSGSITITGLIERTNVKITDTAGNLVYETTSLGGNALWNGKNLWGEKVKSGIYIVLLSSSDGTQTAFTKIAIIR